MEQDLVNSDLRYETSRTEANDDLTCQSLPTPSMRVPNAHW